MDRYLFRIALAASVVIFVATCALWTRSYFICDELGWRKEMSGPLQTTDINATSVKGRLVISYERDTSISYFRGTSTSKPHAIARPYYRRFEAAKSLPPKWLPYGGFQYLRWQMGTPTWASGSAVHIPFWAVLVIAGGIPSVWLAYARRRKPGHCRRCGYDLRATPDRCPECGTPAHVSA